MTEPVRAAMRFSEQMSGWFAMGPSDPQQGEREGRAAKSRLTMDVTVHVDDVRSFARSNDHAAKLTGTVTFAPLAGITAAPGQVRLFAPNSSGAGKLLAYDLPFTHDGREYFLAGRKFVGGGAPWRIWPETTTLHTRLHLGADENGQVAGAGVLRISALGLLNTLMTFRGAGIVGYGGFFATQLWDSYGLPIGRSHSSR